MNKLRTVDRVGGVAKVLCGLSLAVACSPAWSDNVKANYEMAFFSDSAQGSRILSGQYEKAIEKITNKVHGGDTLHVETNLCVAYTKAGDIAAAEAACDAAVDAAKSFRKVRRSDFAAETSAQTRARYMAIVLSNRGVLNAVKGDFDAARADFDAALAQQARVPSVRTNLEKLDIAEQSA